jgi:hypothetical protein
VTGATIANPAGGSYSREDSIKIAMRDATPTLTLADGDFTFEHMPAGASSWTGGTGSPNDVDKVTINYTWKLWTPVLWPFFTNGEILLRVESAMKNEGIFQ